MNLVDSLGYKSPDDALLSLANSCEAMALTLAKELSASLLLDANNRNSNNNNNNNSNTNNGSSPSKRKKADGGGESKKNEDTTNNNNKNNAPRYPIPLPKSLREAPRPIKDDNDNNNNNDNNDEGNNNGQEEKSNTNNNISSSTPSRPRHNNSSKINASNINASNINSNLSYNCHPLTLSLLSSESILSSLSKIASGGSAASSEMRSLESQRRSLDAEAQDIEHALALREGCARGCDMLACQRYGEAARAARDVNSILEGRRTGNGGNYLGATERAKQLCGMEALENHQRTVHVLRNAIGEKYETAVVQGDVAGLSELTPLLGMLDMAELGVRLYLRYSQSVLRREMDLSPIQITNSAIESMGQEEGMSRAAVRRRAEEEQKLRENMSVPQRLAKIYNSAVTHLRHHLPMVAYALGEADGDVALVQVVHVEAEQRACEIMREYMHKRELGLTVRRAEFVGKKIEERYTGGGGGGGGGGTMMGWESMALAAGGGGGGSGAVGMSDENKIANMIMGLGIAGDAASSSSATDIIHRRNAAMKDDCGFTIEVGNLHDVDGALEEWALVMQHTESYERFIRHAVEEVLKARNLRREQKREERRRSKELEDAKSKDAADMGAGSRGSSKDAKDSNDVVVVDVDEQDLENEQEIEILPPHTQLNEVAAEIGGNYSSLERCLLLAGMQRAFIHANFPQDSTFSPVAIGGGNHYDVGSRALQTNLVEECLYAARRSTLRAFATGHTGTASAAANVCVDVLGRVLLEVLTRRAELGATLLKPGEGLLLDGQSGLGQAALSFAKSTAGKGFRGVQGAAARAGASSKVLGEMNEETAEALRMRTLLGVARAAANFNDLEVVAEYTKRLEGNFLKDIDAGYPRGHDTEQLRMCIKGLGGVVESFSHASERAIERLVSTVLPRVRQIVNDAVGQDERSTIPAASFMGSPVLSGATATVSSTRLDYDLDDRAFEMAQISEGYIGRMCSSLDELTEPLRVHLLPKLSDDLLIGILGGVSKRLEVAIRKSKFTPLGALSLDSDVRYFMNFAKDRMDSPELRSNVTLCKACPPLGRLNQIALLLNVDDLEDVLDLISVSKRKGIWDLKMDDAKVLLSLRVDFEGSKVNDLLQIEDES